MELGRILDGKLKLRHLAFVSAIADQGSVLRAAEELHVTQPVATRTLREVEEILGVSLFDRNRRGVVPTVYGESFISHSKAILAQLRQAGHHIDLLSRAELGTVTVGIHLAGISPLLPTSLAAFKEEHPGVTIVVREAMPDVLQEELLSGDIDLIVGRVLAIDSDRLVQEKLHQEPIRLVARSGHPVHQLVGPALAELQSYPWIFPIPDTMLRRELEGAFAYEGVALPSNRIECTSASTMRNLLISTDAIAALPMLFVRGDDRLELLSTPLYALGHSVGVMMKTQTLSPGAAMLLKHLRSEATKLQASRIEAQFIGLN